MKKTMQATSSVLTLRGIKHVVVASNKFDNELTQLLYTNTDTADAEVGDAESFGYYLLFVFKPKEFSKFLAKQKQDISRLGISEKELDSGIAKYEKFVGDLDSGFAVIINEDTEGSVSASPLAVSKARSRWAKLESEYEDFENALESEDPESDDDDFDPESDEYEVEK